MAAISFTFELMQKRMKLIITAMLLFSAAIVFAQPKKIVADKIIGMVGDRIVLKSDIDNQIADAKRQEVDLPLDANCYLMQSRLQPDQADRKVHARGVTAVAVVGDSHVSFPCWHCFSNLVKISQI